MKKLRIGILDFWNIQNAERNGSSLSRDKNHILKKSSPGRTLLAKAIRALGHTPVLYFPEHCQMLFEKDHVEILYRGKKIKGCDVLIPRINVVSNVEIEISIIKQFELMGIPVVNKYIPIARALNKLRGLQILTKAHVRVPKTIIVRRFEYLDEAIEKIGGYPVIIKSVFGTHGKRVAIIESRRSLYSALDILWKFSSSSIILLQEYVAEAEGIDYRAFVIGDKVVAAMKRTAPNGDFRSNLNLGGNGAGAKLTSQEEEIAIKATKAFGLDSCGVDLLRSKKGSMVMEMNPCAGLIGITKATTVNIAEKLVKHAIIIARKNSLKISK